MHYHLEIIMPPTDDVEGAVKMIMEPFDENGSEDEDHDTKHAFWDWYVIGGRWAGAKMLDKFGREKLSDFHKMLSEKKITVSGVQAGKPTLQPAEQIATVDAMWREAFPDSGFDVCPLFDHYKDDVGDVMKLGELPATLCSHVIIAGPGYSCPIEAHYMVSDAIWNGVTHVATAWNGTIEAALAEWDKKLDSYREEWRITHTPSPDWLVVTVDYHS